MPATPFDEFITELDKIIDSKTSAGDKDKTIALLKVGDDAFAADAQLQALITDGTLQARISNDCFIKETFNNETHERPVIDLVQQGGTMLGIGLLGYTYIMEKAGVRFRSMAGTSAGAINTLLLSALPGDKIYSGSSPFINGRQAVKSEFLAHVVANYDFKKFLDRDGFAGKVQKWLINRITMLSRYKFTFFIAAVVFIFGLSFGSYHLISNYLFTQSNGLKEQEVSAYHYITGTLTIVFVILLILFFVFRLFKTTMGFNPGKVPYDWMQYILETKFVNIHTAEQLLARRKEESNNISIHCKDPRIVFISANLTHNRIVKFPENATDYWHKDFAKLATPAAFVRASMSLPFIFHAFIPARHHLCNHIMPLPAKAVHTYARFVDGGTLSNFPIREFHVAPPARPNYPTFGVLLGIPSTTVASPKRFWTESVFKFILSFISTFRNFYDKDFLINHPEFKHLISAVDTSKFNSLDFGMSMEKKQQLFLEGANTAIQQLKNFNWTAYMYDRP